MSKVQGTISQIRVTGDISQLNVTGDIKQSGYSVLLAGIIRGVATVIGFLTGIGKLAGLSSGVAAVTGKLFGTGKLAGISDGVAAITGDISGTGLLTGSSSGVADVSAILSSIEGWVIPITGQTTGTATAGTMVISCTENITITKTGDVTISVVQAADSIYRRHTVTINCPNNGSGTVVIPNRIKVVSLGNHLGVTDPSINFYTGINTTAPILTWDLNDIPATCLKIRQFTEYTVILPTTGNTAFPTGLTFLLLSGSNIAWTYNGAVPAGLTYLYFYSANIAWTYNGAAPTGLIYFNLRGESIYWTYTGILPTNISWLYLRGNNIAWTYNGAAPTKLTYFYLLGTILDWTGLDVTGIGNITMFFLSNYRIAKMSSTDMVTLLTNLTNRVGGLPATVTINDYADYASPPQAVTDAVAALKAAKSITTVNLGA